MNQTTVTLVCPYRLSDETVASLVDDLNADPHLVAPQRGTVESTWFVLILAALGPLWAGMATKWGNQAADALSRAVGRLRNSGSPGVPPPVLELVESDGSDVGFIIDDEAANVDALRVMTAIDTRVYQPGTRLIWNPQAKAWLVKHSSSDKSR